VTGLSSPVPGGIHLPVLPCPFPVKISPFVEELDERTLDWAPGHGILTDAAGQAALRSARFGGLAGRVCADFSRDALLEIADWLVWLFAFDDRFCERAGAHAGPAAMTASLIGFLRVLDAPHADWGPPYQRALADVWRRTRRRASTVQQQRLIAAVHGYFLSLVWEANQSAGTVSLADYRLMRPQTAGVPLWLTLVEIGGGYRPDPVELAQPQVQRLHASIAPVINWMNDIRSYPRESQEPDALILPRIIAAERGCSAEQALSIAAQMYREEVEGYLAAERAVLATAGTALSCYVHSLRHVISGFHAWFHDSGRYS
jgi:Terpene synthase family 2, C-terminal metal binding